MGWAEQLPSGRWRAVYRDGQGKRRSAGTFARKAEADRRASVAEQTARQDPWRDPGAVKLPWGQWADKWWPTRTVAASTDKVDRQRRTAHLDQQWADTPLGAITRQDIRSWAASLHADGLSPETVKRCVHLLSATLSGAVDAEIIQVNPAARLKLPTAKQVHERFLTREEFAAVREQMPTVRDQLILDLLVFTGMRWGELAGLHWPRVDFGRRMLTIAETWDERGGAMKGAPKGKRPRQVPLVPELVQVLGGLPHVGQACGYDHDHGRCPGPLVVTTDGGHVLRNQAWAASVWRPAVAASGVGHVRIHDLRHTYASWLLQQGVPLAEVGQLLGHRSTATTARYAHLQDEPSAAVLAALQGPGSSLVSAAPRLPHG